jgi:hypothetical protein
MRPDWHSYAASLREGTGGEVCETEGCGKRAKAGSAWCKACLQGLPPEPEADPYQRTQLAIARVFDLAADMGLQHGWSRERIADARAKAREYREAARRKAAVA